MINLTPIRIYLGLKSKPVNDHIVIVIGLSYQFGSKHWQRLIYRDKYIDVLNLRIVIYESILRIFIGLYKKEPIDLTHNPIIFLTNYKRLCFILSYQLINWGESDFPLGKYSIAQLKKINNFQERISTFSNTMDIVPKDYSNPKLILILKHLYKAIRYFRHTQFIYVDPKRIASLNSLITKGL